MATSANSPTGIPKPPDAATLAKRAKILMLVTLGKRIGYAGMVGSIIAFVIAAISDFPPWLVNAAIAGLVIACVALPGAIVFGYGIKAAEHEERGGGRFH